MARKDYWEKVHKVPGGCWIWLPGSPSNVTYGPSRAAYAKAHGPIPDGALICHHCDNPTCVNPDHLYAGSNATNGRDRAAPGPRVDPRITYAEILALRLAYRAATQRSDGRTAVRLLVDDEIHARVKVDAAQRGSSIPDAYRAGLERAFPDGNRDAIRQADAGGVPDTQ